MMEINIEEIMEEIRADARKLSGEYTPAFEETVDPMTAGNAQSHQPTRYDDIARYEIGLLLNPDEEHYYGVRKSRVQRFIQKVLRKICNGSVTPLRMHAGVAMDGMYQLMKKYQSENIVLASNLEQMRTRLDEEREKRILLQQKVEELQTRLTNVKPS